jgi:hypothetical protein
MAIYVSWTVYDYQMEGMCVRSPAVRGQFGASKQYSFSGVTLTNTIWNVLTASIELVSTDCCVPLRLQWRWLWQSYTPEQVRWWLYLYSHHRVWRSHRLQWQHISNYSHTAKYPRRHSSMIPPRKHTRRQRSSALHSIPLWGGYSTMIPP